MCAYINDLASTCLEQGLFWHVSIGRRRIGSGGIFGSEIIFDQPAGAITPIESWFVGLADGAKRLDVFICEWLENVYGETRYYSVLQPRAIDPTFCFIYFFAGTSRLKIRSYGPIAHVNREPTENVLGKCCLCTHIHTYLHSHTHTPQQTNSTNCNFTEQETVNIDAQRFL